LPLFSPYVEEGEIANLPTYSFYARIAAVHSQEPMSGITLLLDDDGDKLRTIGHEYGTTTGRNRRCGWYDAPIARYAVRINGLTDFFLT
jgi:hypothetical protein